MVVGGSSHIEPDRIRLTRQLTSRFLRCYRWQNTLSSEHQIPSKVPPRRGPLQRRRTDCVFDRRPLPSLAAPGQKALQKKKYSRPFKNGPTSNKKIRTQRRFGPIGARCCAHAHREEKFANACKPSKTRARCEHSPIGYYSAIRLIASILGTLQEQPRVNAATTSCARQAPGATNNTLFHRTRYRRNRFSTSHANTENQEHFMALTETENTSILRLCR